MSEAQESFISHLVELRDRLVRALIAVGVVFAGLCLYPGPGAIYDLMALPLTETLPEGTKMVAIGVVTPFMVPIKVTMLVAFVLALPVVLYQAWAFVAPGLYRSEKRLALPLLIAAVLLFYLGIAFAYVVLLPAMFAFLTATVPEGVAMMPDINAYLSFVLVMGLAAGLAFEMPIAVLVALMLGWVTPAQLSEWRGYVVVAIAILAALLTPPDGLSMILLMIPMWLLYEAGLLVGRALLRARPAEPA